MVWGGSSLIEGLLRPLGDFTINTKEVGSLEGLEPKAKDAGEGAIVERRVV